MERLVKIAMGDLIEGYITVVYIYRIEMLAS
jgi:hypothetical protein